MCGQNDRVSSRLVAQEDKDMSVSVILEATVKDMDAFQALFLKILPATRSYEGCEGLTVHRNLDDPANVVLVERWESRAHYEKYLAWRDETKFLGQLGALLEDPPSIRFYSNVGV